MRSAETQKIYTALLIVSWFLIILLSVWLFLSPKGFEKVAHLQNEITKLNAENLELKIKNAQLKNEIAYRRGNLFLEELARTELGYSAAGEKIVKWSRSPLPAQNHSDD